MHRKKILLPGGAGLVGQNLVARLRAKGYSNIVVLDKHRANIEVLKRVQPGIVVEYADLAEPGDWQRHFAGADVVVMLQAQIGGNDYQDFVRNNIDSTRLIIDAIKANDVPCLIHISSSVVESVADDFYTNTKKEQEKMVLESGITCPVLRPTLMFGWFDRKHLGWLSRFMKKVPIFPIPGHGRYMRQPLYVMDFANIIILLKEHDVSFASTMEKFDTATPLGNAMLMIVMVFAQLERETIQQRVKDAYLSRSKRGFYMGAASPTVISWSKLKSTGFAPRCLSRWRRS